MTRSTRAGACVVAVVLLLAPAAAAFPAETFKYHLYSIRPGGNGGAKIISLEKRCGGLPSLYAEAPSGPTTKPVKRRRSKRGILWVRRPAGNSAGAYMTASWRPRKGYTTCGLVIYTVSRDVYFPRWKHDGRGGSYRDPFPITSKAIPYPEDLRYMLAVAVFLRPKR